MENRPNPEPIRYEDFSKIYNIYKICYEEYVRYIDDGWGAMISDRYYYKKREGQKILKVEWTEIGVFCSLEAVAEKKYNDWLQSHKKELDNSIDYNCLRKGDMSATSMSKLFMIMNVQLVFVETCRTDGLEPPPSKEEVLRKDYWRD